MVGRQRRAAAVVLAVVLAAAGLAARQVPARIVSTSPSITETLFALGLGDHVVGVSTYCWFPPAVAKLPKIGTFAKPDAELIARLRPDLVVVHTGPHAAASHLAALKIRTVVIETGSLGQVFSTIRQIASAAGVSDRSDRVIGDINARLDRVKGAVAGKPPKKVLIIVGRRTGTLTDMVAAGRSSYLSDIAAIAGGVNVLANATPQYARISMETVISLAPDVLIDIGEMGEQPDTSERRLQITRDLWRRQTLVKAVRDQHVEASTDQAFVVPGPRLVNVAETMAGWFHGVTFK
jgi:iron complex transport system substrate-binding protein